MVVVSFIYSAPPDGAKASALQYNLRETVKENELEPHAYLRFLFEK